jgi:hypothetical protein
MNSDILDELDEETARPLFRLVFTQHMQHSRPSSVRRKGSKGSKAADLEDVLEPIDEEAELESEKNANLHAEKRGKPAHLPVKENDFREGSVRRALKTMPKTMPKTKTK